MPRICRRQRTLAAADRAVPRDVRRELARLGYQLARSRRHLIYKHACGASVSVSTSSSDARGYKNLISDARRALRERGVDDGRKVGQV